MAVDRQLRRFATAATMVSIVVSTACAADGGVEVERVDSVVSSPPSTAVDESSSIDDSADELAERPSSTMEPARPDPRAMEREPDLGVGDELFPALGSSDIDVLSYDVAIDATEPTATLAGTVRIVADVPVDLGRVALDAQDPEVISVVADGDPVDFEQVDGELLIDTTVEHVADGQVEFEIDFEVEAGGRRSIVGLPVGWITAGDGAYVLNEPDGASTWLPSSDHPSDKAIWRFEITTRGDHVASANGALLARPADGVAGTWVWEQDEPMATYLVHLVVGEYELIDRATVSTATGTEIPLTHLVPVGRTEEFTRAIDSVADQIAFMEARFGPYPLDRYGLAFVDGLSGLAMETQGRSLFGADDFADGRLGFGQELLLSHELAHQWFGNAVSPAAWDDLWLNESLTTYAQWLWLDEVGLQPLDDWATRMLSERQTSSVDATADPDVRNLFGFERYDGGAVAVHALRLTIGDEAFFELMRTWVADNTGTSGSTEAFMELAEATARRSLGEFFDDWIFAVVPPSSYPG